MEHFQNYQVGSWLSNGLMIRVQELAENAFSVVKEKIAPALIASAAVAACAASLIAIPKSDFAVTISRTSPDSSVTSEFSPNAPKSLTHAAVAEQIASLQDRMADFRARLATRQFGLTAETLQVARKARESSDARASEAPILWATRLIKSQAS